MNQIYEVRGIPEVLDRRPKPIHSGVIRKQIETIMEHNPRAIIPVSGDCLEGAGNTQPTKPSCNAIFKGRTYKELRISATTKVPESNDSGTFSLIFR